MLIPAVVALTSLVTAIRLLTYERGNSRYRLNVSLLAYALIVCSGAQVIDVIINGVESSAWQAGMSIALMLLVIRSRGNVSCILDGVEK